MAYPHISPHLEPDDGFRLPTGLVQLDALLLRPRNPIQQPTLGMEKEGDTESCSRVCLAWSTLGVGLQPLALVSLGCWCAFPSSPAFVIWFGPLHVQHVRRNDPIPPSGPSFEVKQLRPNAASLVWG